MNCNALELSALMRAMNSKAEAYMGIRSRKLIKDILRPPARVAFQALSWAEGKLTPHYQLRYCPTFIIGPPRSGSTLLYQLVTCALGTSYFTNFAIRLYVKGSPAIPIIAARLAKSSGLVKRHRETFQSSYGNGQGLGGPDEGCQIWDPWFPKGYVGSGELSPGQQRTIYQAVAATERIFDRPFVTKQNSHSVRIKALVEIFPTAIFIQSVRDPLATAQSIFIARSQDFPHLAHRPEDPSKAWFSVKPREYKSIKEKGLIEQACEQVYFVEQNIATDRAIVGEDRFHSVHYRELCQDPHREIKKIADFMTNHGAPVHTIRSTPASFRYSSGRKIDRTNYLAMRTYLEKLYGRAMEGAEGIVLKILCYISLAASLTEGVMNLFSILDFLFILNTFEC